MTRESDAGDLVGQAVERLAHAGASRVRGRITAVAGLMMRATLPRARVGELVRVIGPAGEPLTAEIVGFRADEVLLMPLGDVLGVGPESLVEVTGERLSVPCGDSLLGRVLDGLGQPIDGQGPLTGPLTSTSIDRLPPGPLERPRITAALSLGVRAIDGLLTVGEGQRVGLFAGSGVGKSTLLGQIARCSDADVSVVCLVGERGREVREFIDDALGEGLQRSVVICATSDAPPLVRLKSALVATAVAEGFRDRGQRVLLLMDSVTRYARALREVGLASGEPPTRRGYPPSVFAQLPRLLERSGTAPMGSISAIYTVLVEGDDLEEPIADEVRGILDGHIVLSRRLAERGHWPAIDVLASLSRLMSQLASPMQQQCAGELRALLAAYENQRDLILMGAYQSGSDPQTDRAIGQIEAIEQFLRQRPDERSEFDETQQALSRLIERAS
jgi:type III secretion protein N (ATPase)